MRPVLVGLVAIGSLATSLIGPAGLGGIPSVAACDARFEDCDYDRQDPLDLEEEAYYDCLEDKRWDDEFGHEEAARKNEWVDTHLAAEKAIAVYWRVPLVKKDCETGDRIGQLDEVPMSERTISYICDPNYANALSGGCVPADRDYDCDELRAWGIVDVHVYRIVPPDSGGLEGALGSVVEWLPWTEETPIVDEDWMLLDDDHDGRGCEFVTD